MKIIVFSQIDTPAQKCHPKLLSVERPQSLDITPSLPQVSCKEITDTENIRCKIIIRSLDHTLSMACQGTSRAEQYFQSPAPCHQLSHHVMKFHF